MYKANKTKIALPTTGNRLIATFMAAITPLERYLRRGRPLTGLQVESLSLALRTLETFLEVWKASKGYKVTRAKQKSAGSWFLNETDKNRLSADKNRDQMSRNWAAVILGRRGGLKGGNARAEKLSAERRIAIARLAVKARWARRKG